MLNGIIHHLRKEKARIQMAKDATPAAAEEEVPAEIDTAYHGLIRAKNAFDAAATKSKEATGAAELATKVAAEAKAALSKAASDFRELVNPWIGDGGVEKNASGGAASAASELLLPQRVKPSRPRRRQPAAIRPPEAFSFFFLEVERRQRAPP